MASEKKEQDEEEDGTTTRGNFDFARGAWLGMMTACRVGSRSTGTGRARQSRAGKGVVKRESIR